MIKRVFLLTSILLLSACGTDSIEETPANLTNDADSAGPETENVETDAENNTEADEEDSTQSEEGAHVFTDFVNESTFMDPYALEAWEDYQTVAADVNYGEITVLQTENPDLSQLEGSSLSEVESLFDAADLREDVYKEAVDVSDTEALHFYRYPAEAESDLNEVSDFLVELSYYFIDDNLVFSSITPGLYQVDLNNLPDAEILTTFRTVPEITSIEDPQVFTIAEMNVDNYLIHQIMVPATYVNEEGTEETMAFYFFTHGEDILHYAFLPFEMVSQSFPDNSIILYQQIIPELVELDLDEILDAR